MRRPARICIFFFFNDTATTEIYTLSLHDALPISPDRSSQPMDRTPIQVLFIEDSAVDVELALHSLEQGGFEVSWEDRKSTRLNSSHLVISYAVFCLKKKQTHRPRSSAHCVAARVV